MVTTSDDRQRTFPGSDTRTVWWRVFLEHPHAAGQGYFEHLVFAWSVGTALLRAALAAFVHGAVPALHTSTAGNTVRRLYHTLPASVRTDAAAASESAGDP